MSDVSIVLTVGSTAPVISLGAVGTPVKPLELQPVLTLSARSDSTLELQVVEAY